MKKTPFLFIFVVFLFFSSRAALAEAVLHIHLFYNSEKTITFDKSFSPPVSLDKSKNIYVTEFDEKYQNPGPYELVFLDSDNITINQIQFTPPVGAFTIDAPDYGITKTIAIRKTGESSYVLKQDTTQYVSCNNNNICEYEKGETEVGCMQDCRNEQPKYSTQTTQLLNKGNGKISDPVSGKTVIKEQKPETVPVINKNDSEITNNKGLKSVPPIQKEDVTTDINNLEPAPTGGGVEGIAWIVLIFGVILALIIVFLLFRHRKSG